MKKFAVIGNPVEHSRSPVIHRQFADQFDLPVEYDRILAFSDNFAPVVRQFFAGGGDGLNVTVPFKELAYEVADELTPRASAARAVNTLMRVDGRLIGDNTDGAGLVWALSRHLDLEHTRILIIGAGGATRGVILPLLLAGADHITIANRTPERARQLIDDLESFIPVSGQLGLCTLDEMAGHFDVVINATSATLTGASLNWPAQVQARLACEMAYGKPSAFLQQAAEKSIETADGLGMLVGQAAESFYQWTGLRPDPTRVRF